MLEITTGAPDSRRADTSLKRQHRCGATRHGMVWVGVSVGPNFSNLHTTDLSFCGDPVRDRTLNFRRIFPLADIVLCCPSCRFCPGLRALPAYSGECSLVRKLQSGVIGRRSL